VKDLGERYRERSVALAIVAGVGVIGVLLIVGAALAARGGLDLANPFDCRRCGLPTLVQNVILVGGCLVGTAIIAAIVYVPAAYRRAIVRRTHPAEVTFFAGRQHPTVASLKRVAPRVNGTTPLVPSILVVSIGRAGVTIWGLLAEPLLELTWEQVTDAAVGEVVVGIRRVPTLRLTVRLADDDETIELLPARPRSDGFLFAKLSTMRELANEVLSLRALNRRVSGTDAAGG